MGAHWVVRGLSWGCDECVGGVGCDWGRRAAGRKEYVRTQSGLLTSIRREEEGEGLDYGRGASGRAYVQMCMRMRVQCVHARYLV